jgi:hypothetical protein
MDTGCRVFDRVENFFERAMSDHDLQLKLRQDKLVFVSVMTRQWPVQGNTKGGKYHCTFDLLCDWFGISCMTTDSYCFYLQYRLQTSQTGDQWYSDTSPFGIPGLYYKRVAIVIYLHLLSQLQF